MNSKFETKSFNFLTCDWAMKSPKCPEEKLIGDYSIKFKKKVGDSMLHEEMIKNYEEVILPYWKNLIDKNNGGFYGYVDYDLNINLKAEKGVILNSRILWFFSNAYLLTKQEDLLLYADHAYEFLIDKCLDHKNGGVFWMLNYDGSIKDSMKHTYNQSFAIYSLSAYYEATRKENARDSAMNLFQLIEKTCTDEYGYLESFTQDWELISNEKLSGNGLIADKTMNTLLHVLEAYTELYKITKNLEVRDRLINLLNIFHTKVFNRKKRRLEVFFDKKMNSIVDLYSYGHDIEASWLLDRACTVLDDQQISKKTKQYTDILVEDVFIKGFENGSMNNECLKGVINKTKVWWVQAESIVGFYNAYEKSKDLKYLEVVNHLWNYIKENFIDKRNGGEWFWDLNEQGIPESRRPITEPWKCPYHNGRMCFEIYKRQKNI